MRDVQGDAMRADRPFTPVTWVRIPPGTLQLSGDFCLSLLVASAGVSSGVTRRCVIRARGSNGQLLDGGAQVARRRVAIALGHPR